MPLTRERLLARGKLPMRNCETAGLPLTRLRSSSSPCAGWRQTTGLAEPLTHRLMPQQVSHWCSPSCPNRRFSQQPATTSRRWRSQGGWALAPGLAAYAHCEHKWRHDSHPAMRERIRGQDRFRLPRRLRAHPCASDAACTTR
jgi:hypothetical protein